jgi:hypothetical protein
MYNVTMFRTNGVTGEVTERLTSFVTTKGEAESLASTYSAKDGQFDWYDATIVHRGKIIGTASGGMIVWKQEGDN